MKLTSQQKINIIFIILILGLCILTGVLFSRKNSERGADGAKGDKGDKGSQGSQGTRGSSGSNGPKGDQGPTGSGDTSGFMVIRCSEGNGAGVLSVDAATSILNGHNVDLSCNGSVLTVVIKEGDGTPVDLLHGDLYKNRIILVECTNSAHVIQGLAIHNESDGHTAEIGYDTLRPYSINADGNIIIKRGYIRGTHYDTFPDFVNGDNVTIAII